MEAGCFQFFYASKEEGLPHPDIPTRDVTGTWGHGNKTEPHLERDMENWCRCRARNVSANVRRALKLCAGGGQHYMILTTNCPRTGAGFAVGVVEFSVEKYNRARKLHPARWENNNYLPYVGWSKLVSFSDAFPLDDPRLPGKRYGIVNTDGERLRRILNHFHEKGDRKKEFLENVTALERKLQADPERWIDYSSRKRGMDSQLDRPKCSNTRIGRSGPSGCAK